MNKYHNIKCQEDGYTFDSRKELDRYRELRLRAFAGEISSLEVHPVYELQPAFRHCGKWIAPITYAADFRYIEVDLRSVQGFRQVVEDVKGIRTKEFMLKRALLLHKYPDMDFRIIGEAPKRRRDKIAKRFKGKILSDTGR